MAKQSKNKEIQAYLETRSKELEKLIEVDKFERHHYRKFFEDLGEKFFDKRWRLCAFVSCMQPAVL